ncbi:hypothetical protein GCM10028825_07470 [Spirosoma agri]
MNLLTPHQKQLQKRNKKIKALYERLIGEGGQKTACAQKVMEKFGIRSRVTVWQIVKNGL